MKRFRFFLILPLLLLSLSLPARALSLRPAAKLCGEHLSADSYPDREALSALFPGYELRWQLPLSRAQFAALVAEWLDGSELELPARSSVLPADLELSGINAPFVKTVVEGGVMGADENGMFRPDSPVTSGEAALTAARVKAFSVPRQSLQPASTLPLTPLRSEDVLADCCMLGHSNVVGLDMSVPTALDIIAQIGISATGFLGTDDLSFGRNGDGYAFEGLQRRQYRQLYIMLGTNDLPVGRSALEPFRQSMRDIIELCRYYQPGAGICLLSVTPLGVDTPFYPQEILDYNRALKELSRELGTDYLDLFMPLATRNGGNKPMLARDDGIHYSVEGYQTILNVILSHFPDTETLS